MGSRGDGSSKAIINWRRGEPSSNLSVLLTRLACVRATKHMTAERTIAARESAGVEVERPQVVVEVDMQPLASGGACLTDGDGDQLGADPPTSSLLRDEGVDDEGVGCAIPRYVDESDQLATVPSTDPPQAMAMSSSRMRCPKPSACRALTSALSKSPRHW
jgi:hypothetical protein